MSKYLVFACILFLFSCSTSVKKDEQKITSEERGNIDEKGLNYELIKDDLYTDRSGNLYLKTINNEDFDDNGNLFPKDAWLKTVYCDSCWTPTESGWEDITELKDFVDTLTWRYDTSSNYWTEYTDKKYRYHHTHMADGGTISLMKK